MKWNELKSLDELNDLVTSSFETPHIVFKHSTSCPISAVMKSRFEGDWKKRSLVNQHAPYLLDLLKYRDISNEIAKKFEVKHESPQVLLIQNGNATFHASHAAISVQILSEFLHK